MLASASVAHPDSVATIDTSSVDVPTPVDSLKSQRVPSAVDQWQAGHRNIAPELPKLPELNPNAWVCDAIGLRFREDWYLVRMGIGLEYSTSIRLWRMFLGAGVRRHLGHSTLDSVKSRVLESGFEARLQMERTVPGPGPLSFQVGFGPALEWEWTERRLDSSALGKFHPANPWQDVRAYTPSRSRVAETRILGVLGIGARVQAASGFALVGGLEVGPVWSFAETSSQIPRSVGDEDGFGFRDPVWILGTDWFF